jgi:hypothetical protein
MAVDNIKIPSRKEAIPRVIDLHAEREESRLVYRRTMWLLAWYYLNGARRFDIFDPVSGLIQPHFLDEDGNMEFQSGELLSQIDRVSGRLTGLDLRAKVEREGMSLGAIRDRAVGQIIADATESEQQLKNVQKQFAHIFTMLGCAGIAGHVLDHPTVGLTTDLEVIHPTELFPFPSLGADFTKQRGLLRQRTVPLTWLIEKYGSRIMRNLEQMEWWEQQIGEILSDVDEYDIRRSGAYTFDARNSGPGDLTDSDTTHGVVKIRELWLYGPRETVDRYIICSGDYLIDDQQFDGLEVYCPVGVARFLETSTFHGLGLFDLLFSISRELERMLKQLFNNIRDVDKYGLVVIPQGEWNERAQLRDVGDHLRVLTWEPDPLTENFRPFNVQPFTMGDIPGRTAAFAKEMTNAWSPIQDLIAEKGRVDSAAGLAFLDEQVNQAMNNATISMREAFSTCHRSVLQGTARMLSQTPRPLPVSRLTLDLAGARINPEDLTINFDDNPLPTIGQLRITVQDRNAGSAVARKQEAIQLFGLSDITSQDLDGLKLFALEEGLDFAMYTTDFKAAYESIVRNILLLYGDGQSPGEIVVTPHTVKPNMQMRVLEGFMGSPAMMMASPDVQDEFMKFRSFMLESMGMVLPAAVPNPDDAAMLSMAMQDRLPAPPQQQPQGVA